LVQAFGSEAASERLDKGVVDEFAKTRKVERDSAASFMSKSSLSRCFRLACIRPSLDARSTARSDLAATA
jgi:hypothetical protein